MTAYRVKAYMGGLQVDQVVEAADGKEAILKVSENVDNGTVEVVEDGFTGNKRVHITYEEIVNVK
jgi:hypothetical protein|tara:strand:+ start:3505 stop:3699 length:195 start_codon:yes stop_codon:yes gene_type:complete